MTDAPMTIHCHVSGRVQGVCFRMAAREQASLLGISGWVRNLPDGRVEVMASGNEDRLKDFKDWLKKGPELARVLELDVREVEYQPFDGFSVR